MTHTEDYVGYLEETHEALFRRYENGELVGGFREVLEGEKWEKHKRLVDGNLTIEEFLELAGIDPAETCTPEKWEVFRTQKVRLLTDPGDIEGARTFAKHCYYADTIVRFRMPGSMVDEYRGMGGFISRGGDY